MYFIVRLLALISVAAISLTLHACSGDPDTAPANAPRNNPLARLQPTNDGYDWGETVVNPGRTAALPGSLAPGDWPGFRGANRDGHAPGVRFDLDWAANPPKELWRRRVGDGRSSFAAIGDYIFTQEQRGPHELVVCYEAATGEEIWINSIRGRLTSPQGDGPSATPTFDDGRLYTQGALGALQCLDAATGSVIWHVQLQEATRARQLQFGFSSSPLIIDDLVFVFVHGNENDGVAAFAKDTGTLAWNAGQSRGTYSSPHRARIDGTDQLLLATNFGIEALHPPTGEVLWDHRWPPKGFARCIQPVVTEDGGVILVTPRLVATRRVQVQRSGDAWSCIEDWTRDGFAPYFNDIIYHEGYCYGTHLKNLACIDAKSGAEQWRERVFGGQMLLLPDMGAVLSLAARGKVMVFNATPSGFEELASMQVSLRGKALNHPVIAGGRLFVRSETEMIGFALPH